jgi:anti-anti-sigma regulatory factor
MSLFEIPHSRAVIDLSGVNHLDSTGFAMFLHMLRVSRTNYCTFRLCSLTPAAQNLFALLQLDKAFDIYTDFDSCLQSFVRKEYGQGNLETGNNDLSAASGSGELRYGG